MLPLPLFRHFIYLYFKNARERVRAELDYMCIYSLICLYALRIECICVLFFQVLALAMTFRYAAYIQSHHFTHSPIHHCGRAVVAAVGIYSAYSLYHAIAP